MKKILLISGSARRKSTSQSMIDHMKKTFEAKGCIVSEAAMVDVFDKRMAMKELLKKIQGAECIGMFITCYVNTAPYPVIWVMEQLAQADPAIFKDKYLFAIGHGGMPYTDVHENCVRICQCFAQQMDMKWLGGVIRGLTPMVNGRPLEELGRMGKTICDGLDLVADDVMAQRHIQPKAQKKLNIFFPSIFNPAAVLMLNHIAAKERKEKGVVDFDKKVYLMK